MKSGLRKHFRLNFIFVNRVQSLTLPLAKPVSCCTIHSKWSAFLIILITALRYWHFICQNEALLFVNFQLWLTELEKTAHISYCFIQSKLALISINVRLNGRRFNIVAGRISNICGNLNNIGSVIYPPTITRINSRWA